MSSEPSTHIDQSSGRPTHTIYNPNENMNTASLPSNYIPGTQQVNMASGKVNAPEHLDSDTEKIIEISPNGRYAKLNCVLGKGAYKVVFKAMDREEGYEVAWNTCQVCNFYYYNFFIFF